MTHEDAGHYSAKHPSGATYDPTVAAALGDRADAGRVACAAAFEVAKELGVAPAEVGKTTDLLEYRLVECQLGLFGSSFEREIPADAADLPEELRTQLAPFADKGEITCAKCWSIADRLGTPRMTASAACETLGIKIKRCQLGAF